jgi:hypothetical protein
MKRQDWINHPGQNDSRSNTEIVSAVYNKWTLKLRRVEEKME